MRALPVRRIATTFLCTALLLGTAGPVHAASHDDPARDAARDAGQGAARIAPQAPVPGADALLAQTKQLAGLGGVLTPATDLLTAVLKAPDGKVPAPDLAKLTDAVKKGLDAAKAPAPKGPELPGTAADTPKLPLGGAPEAKSAPLGAKAPLDVKADAAAALQKAVDALVKAVTAGDPKAIAKEVPAVITGLVNFAVATLLGGGLPKPNLPGLPKLPA
ncbi:hypothetical protein [Streptomyces silvensis]|uniref:Secreted protein n=1 Tax=Streptomyces silvensis TaxID=1765722 RepID=A0A0W7WZ29_9ACTN|nr:hypothetical protein [Streptomyces silvensis]KUF15830.1 hypothetical protein AT728_14055 [Streptomyces silvensis]